MEINMHISVCTGGQMCLCLVYLYMERSKRRFKAAAVSVLSWRNPWQQMIIYVSFILPSSLKHWSYVTHTKISF